MYKYSTALFFAILVVSAAVAQNRFIPVTNIPVTAGGHILENAWAGGINAPQINTFDLNHDGIMDLLLYDRLNERLLPFLNLGLPGINTWKFSGEYVDSFPRVNKWLFTYDYNCDGKMDLFMLSDMYPGIKIYRNDYSPSGGYQWTLVNSFLQEQWGSITTNVFASGVSLPAFADLDGDGDMDILGYNSWPDGRLLFHKNNSMENYGICDSLDFKYESGCWGNFALLMGSTSGYNKVGCFSCPCREGIRDGSDPASLNYDPSENAKRDDTISDIFPIDLDCDGDFELLFGDVSSVNSLMVHNGGTPASALMDSQDTLFPSYDTPAVFRGFHFHGFADLDNDGNKDLIVAATENENIHGMWWYRNTGTSCSPIFQFSGDSFLQETMIDVGENATPVLVDYDGDNLLDMIIGATVYNGTANPPNYTTSLSLFKNTGTTTSPSFELINNDFAGLSTLGYISPVYPAFGDLDGDGDQDMILGSDDGKLQYFTNSAGAGNPMDLQLSIPNFPGGSTIDVGSTSTPQLVDLNRDGKLDLVIGNKGGTLSYFQNNGTALNPVFSAVANTDSLGCIRLRPPGAIDGFTVPFFYDTLGKYRLLVSNMAGNIYSYKNIDNNLSGCFTLTDSVYPKSRSNRIRFNVTVSGGDLNGDLFPDIVAGQSSGGVEVFYQYTPTLGTVDMKPVKPTMELFPNPPGEFCTLRFFHPDPGESHLSITDITGRKILEKEINTGELSIPVNLWSPGIYLIWWNSGKYSLIRKLLIQH